MPSPKGSSKTIADVAKLAGVSTTTVSRVLNGEKYVREDKRTAVEDAMRKLEYQPNVYARSLAGDRSYLVGLLFDDPQGDYLAGMQRGAMQQCQQYGYHVVVEVFNQKTTLDQIKSFLTKLSLSGVILTPPVCDNNVVLAALADRNIPTVRISPSKPFLGMVDIKIDDYKAATLMTEYLIGLGHKDIGFIVGDLEHADANERYRAFKDAMEAVNLQVNNDWVAQGSYLFESGLEASRKILANDQKPTAILSSNDDMAAAVLVVADEYNLSVPDELSVTGFDNIPLASVVSPSLTTMHQPVEEMAMIAVEQLVKLKNGDSVPQIPLVMDVTFIERKSTAVAPVKKI